MRQVGCQAPGAARPRPAALPPSCRWGQFAASATVTLFRLGTSIRSIHVGGGVLRNQLTSGFGQTQVMLVPLCRLCREDLYETRREGMTGVGATLPGKELALTICPLVVSR